MSDKFLINQPKMSLVKKIRKNIAKIFINKKNYMNLPDYVRNDVDIINKMIKKDISAIEVLTEELAIEYIKKNPNILVSNYFKEKDLTKYYVEKVPELFKGLPINKKYEIVFIDKKLQFIKDLDERLQLDIIIGSPIIISMPLSKQKAKSSFSHGKIINERECPGNSVLVDFKIVNSYFDNNLNNYSENVIYNAVKTDYKKTEYFNFKSLSPDVQLKIAIIENRLLEKMDKAVIDKFVNQNPILLSMISEEEKNRIIQQNPMLERTITKYYEAKIGKEEYLKKASCEKIIMNCFEYRCCKRFLF